MQSVPQTALHVALAQIDITLADPAANLAQVTTLAATAAAQGAHLLVLPELWSTGYSLPRARALADAPGTGMHAALAQLARAQGIAIAGSTLTWQGDAPANVATLYLADGSLLLDYSKLHLFGLMDEDRYLAAGERMPVAAAPWGSTALAICYDLRFPELFRAYALAGAAVCIVPAEWPHPRIQHWRTLVQARAIENQCFMVAVNCVGSDEANTFGGHSLVVAPGGDVLVEGDEQAQLLYATLDIAEVAATRGRIPVLRDRRADVYGSPIVSSNTTVS